MNKTIKLVTVSLLVAFFTGQAYAAAPRWKVDPAHSGIYFGVDHIYSTVRGFFEEFDSTTHFDPDSLGASSFDFSVKVKSVNTNNRKRDGHLRSDDFFGAGKYPEMTFKSTRITHKKGNQYVVEGKMTVKDVTRNVNIPFTFYGIQDNPFNPKEAVAGFEARFTFDRLAYHVGNGKFMKLGVVGQEVDVVISMEMIRKK
jgi:polyisoprenoid-binding protein YceI